MATAPDAKPPEEIPAVPENAEDRPAAWNRLIRGLFIILRQAVDRRDREACDRVEAILGHWWDEALSLDGTADLFGIPRVRLDDQWRAAGYLTRCARWIVEQPPGRAWGAIDQAIAQAVPGDLPAKSGFDPVTTWGWIASLRGARVAYVVKVPVVLIDLMRPDAVVAELRLELIEVVVGGAFADPEQALVGVFAAEFRDAMALAWDAAAWAMRAEAGDRDDRCLLAAGRYRLDYPGTVAPSRAVADRSAGGAAAYGWWHAFRSCQPDPGVAVLAEVVRDNEGEDDPPRFRLASVKGLADKIHALTNPQAQDRTIDTIVVKSLEKTFDCSARIVIADEVSTDPDRGLLARRSAMVEDQPAYLLGIAKQQERISRALANVINGKMENESFRSRKILYASLAFSTVVALGLACALLFFISNVKLGDDRVVVDSAVVREQSGEDLGHSKSPAALSEAPGSHLIEVDPAEAAKVKEAFRRMIEIATPQEEPGPNLLKMSAELGRRYREEEDRKEERHELTGHQGKPR
jgi:hypothetical protein